LGSRPDGISSISNDLYRVLTLMAKPTPGLMKNESPPYDFYSLYRDLALTATPT